MGVLAQLKKHASAPKGAAHKSAKANAKAPNAEQIVEHLSLMRAGLRDADFAKLLRDQDLLLFTVLEQYGWRGSFKEDKDYIRNFEAVKTKLVQERAAAIAEATEVGQRPVPEEEGRAPKTKDFQMSPKFRPGGFTNADIPYGPDAATQKETYDKEVQQRRESEKEGQKGRFILLRKYLTRHGVMRWDTLDLLMQAGGHLTIDDFRVLKRNGLTSRWYPTKGEVIAAIDSAVGPDDFAAQQYAEAEEERQKAGAELRRVMEKNEAVAMGGAGSTFGRVAGALAGKLTGHNWLKWSEHGAGFGAPADALQMHGGPGEGPSEDYFEPSLENSAEAAPREEMPAPDGHSWEGPAPSSTAETPAGPVQESAPPLAKATGPADPMEAELNAAFAKLESGELAPEHGALLRELMFHSQRQEALRQLREQLGQSLPTRPGKTPEGASVNPNPGYQSAHMSPQAAMRGLAEYNPGDMITRFLATGKGHPHTVFDQAWQAECREILNSGRTTMTAQELYDVVSRAAMNSGAFSPAEGRSVSGLVANDLFFQLGLSPTTLLRVPGS